MTEIRVDTDLPHPVERVWKALTDPQVLRHWFMPVEFDGDPPTKLVLRPTDVPGFDEPVQAEIVDVSSQRRAIMRWYASQLHTSVVVLLEPLPAGCRLTFVQRGFLGPQGTLRRRVLQRTYQQMAGPQLRSALERLAEAERDRANLIRRQAGAPGAGGRAGRRNDARFLATTRQAWEGLLRASRNMAMLRPPSDPGSRPLRHPPVKGVAPPQGEALRESPTAAISRRFWRRKKRWLGGGSSGGSGSGGSAGLPSGEWATGEPEGKPQRVRCVLRAGSAARRPEERLWQPLVASGGRGQVATAASAAILVLLTTLAVLIDVATQPGGPVAAAAVGKVTSSHRPSPAHSLSGTRPSPLPTDSGAVRPPSVTLTAAYHTERHIVGGYEGIVTINNLSSQTVDGWQVRLVLPPFGLVVNTVQGARVEQSEREVVFTPTKDSRLIPAGRPTRFTFRVQGIGSPVECEINDQPCAGVPERPV